MAVKYFDHDNGVVTATYARKQHKDQDKHHDVFIGDMWDGTNVTPGDRGSVEQNKSSRNLSVSNIIVTVDGMSFDGCIDSQNAISRRLQVLNSNNSTCSWKLSDGSVSIVNKSQLLLVLELAVAEQDLLWIV